MTLEQKIEELVITRRLAGKFNVGSAVIAHALVDENNGEVVGGGNFYSFETARVDPSGDDTTGVVGDLMKPFLTVQGAIDAIEAGSFTYPIIDVGMNQYFGTTVTTSLPRIRFVGAGDEIGVSATAEYYVNICDNLILTADNPVLELSGCEIKTVAATGGGGLGTLKVFLENAGITTNPAITAEGPIKIAGNGYVRAVVNDVVVSNSGGAITIRNAYVDTIDSPGSDVTAEKLSVIGAIFSAHNLVLKDSRVASSASLTGTKTQQDTLLKTIVFPDADPHIAGAGYWDAGVLTKSAG